MLFLKFSLIFSFLISPAFAISKFTSDECLNSEFETKLENAPRFFGLLKNNLKITKKKCEIDIQLENFFNKIWNIDICREPVHFKMTSKSAPDVFKREKKCFAGDKTPFCEYWYELFTVLQEQGLVFANGIKENIKDQHGQIYCTYILLQRYLDDGIMFSHFENNIDIFHPKKSHTRKEETNEEEIPQGILPHPENLKESEF
jgi:hypothetical protein